jgi:hypothetical protein
MYLAELLTAFHVALTRTFDDEYPVPKFRNIKVSLDFPVERQGYPGVWIDYEPGELAIAGIGHQEFTTNDDDTGVARLRWTFSGRISFTIVALSSLERASLFDEMIKIIAFGQTADSRRQFRSLIERNELIALSANWDNIRQSGSASTTGTPWDTDEQIYEITVSIGIQGEFVSDALTGALLPVTDIDIIAYSETDDPPAAPSSDGWV